jgi:hypothetical protein
MVFQSKRENSNLKMQEESLDNNNTVDETELDNNNTVDETESFHKKNNSLKYVLYWNEAYENKGKKCQIFYNQEREKSVTP